MELSRRRLLQATGSAGTLVLAGCTDDGSADGNGADPDADGNETDASDAGGNATDATDGDDGSGEGAGETPSDPESAARQFTSHLFAGEYEAVVGLFSDTYADQVSAAQVERTRLGFDAALGSFQEIQSTETGVQSGFESVDLTYAFAEGTGDFLILTNQDAELTGFQFAGEYEQADYAEPDAFEATEHTLEPEGCQLDATLTVPDRDEPAPGVVLVHGSLPQDQDLTSIANEPFRDLAEGLASNGVAVLRYDKRTFACSVPPEEQTIDRVTIDDALFAANWLRDADGVDADRVAVTGHSLGAMLAPEIASRDDDLAGAVGLAAPARPLEDVFLDQVEHLATVGERTMQGAEERRRQWERAAEQVRNGNYESDEVLLNHPGAFWESVDGYDPIETASELDVPQAYHQGGRDYQVTVEDDFSQWREAFGDDDSVALSEYEQLNHAFMPGHGPQVPEAYAVPNQVSEELVTTLAEWVQTEL